MHHRFKIFIVHKLNLLKCSNNVGVDDLWDPIVFEAIVLHDDFLIGWNDHHLFQALSDSLIFFIIFVLLA